MDLLINSLDSTGTRIPAQSMGNTSYVANDETPVTVTLNLYTIIYDVSSIQPVVRYRYATAPSNTPQDTSVYILIETCA
jgi:hypothetical protein